MSDAWWFLPVLLHASPELPFAVVGQNHASAHVLGRCRDEDRARNFAQGKCLAWNRIAVIHVVSDELRLVAEVVNEGNSQWPTPTP